MDNGPTNRLEDLRDEMRMIHTRPAKGFENVASGIMEFGWEIS